MAAGHSLGGDDDIAGKFPSDDIGPWGNLTERLAAIVVSDEEIDEGHCALGN